MGVTLAKGGNVSLSGQAPGLTAVVVGIGWQAGPGYEPDASALVCGRDGRVLSDSHFVFFNNPQSPDGSVRHSRGAADGDDQRIHVELDRVPDEAEKIVFPVSLYEGAARGQTFRQVRAAHIRVADAETGKELARYDLAVETLGEETALVLGELYRHGAQWKFRAVGQGYASGLAGIATDYGVDVLRPAEPGPAPAGSAPPAAAPPTRPAAAAPASPPEPPARPLHVPPVPAATPPRPTADTTPPPGSPAMTCFFDPSHGPGTATVTWSPQWGVPRPIQTCGACAQRVQTTPPPFYTPVQQGYPQAGYPQQGCPQPGYPQQGYPAPGYPQQGYPAPYGDPYDHDRHQQGGGRRFGAGALIGAGAAGLVGGALLNEAFDDDEPDVEVNEFFEE